MTTRLGLSIYDSIDFMSVVIETPIVEHGDLEGAEIVHRPSSAPSLLLRTPTWTKEDPPQWLTEATARSCYGLLEAGIGNFCTLELRDRNTYVQAAFSMEGAVAWRLEWRITEGDGSYVHYFARRPGHEREVIYQIDDVITTFKAFYLGQGLPDSLEWTPFDIQAGAIAEIVDWRSFHDVRRLHWN